MTRHLPFEVSSLTCRQRALAARPREHSTQVGMPQPTHSDAPSQQPGSDPQRDIANLPPLSAWLAKKHRSENKSVIAFKYALRFFWCACFTSPNLPHQCFLRCPGRGPSTARMPPIASRHVASVSTVQSDPPLPGLMTRAASSTTPTPRGRVRAFLWT